MYHILCHLYKQDMSVQRLMKRAVAIRYQQIYMVHQY